MKGEKDMEYHKKDLTKEAFCTTRQQFSFGEIDARSAVSRPLTVYSIVTDVIKGVLSHEFEKEEIHELIDEAGELSELPAEDEAIKKSCEEMVKNYFALMYGRGDPVLVNTEMVSVDLPYTDGTVQIRPDVVYDNGQTVEVVFIKTGSLYVMGDEFLPSMYNGVLFGRTFIPEGETREVLCSYVEVKKAKTQSIRDELWPLPKGLTSELDDRAKSEFEELSQGTECEGKDCKYCPGRFECHYVAPALALNAQKTMKSKKVMLSDAQKCVVAFGA